MKLGTIPNYPGNISALLNKIMPVFVEFDRDFIDSDDVIMWEVETRIVYDAFKFLRMMRKNPKLLMLGYYQFSHYPPFKDVIHCWEKEDVSHIGDDASWLPYQTPVVYNHFGDYDYFLTKYLANNRLGPSLMLYIRGWGNRASVKFYAYGKNSRKYLRMVRRLFGI